MKLKPSLLLEGTLKRHPDGFGFFIPDDSKYPDIYIPSGQIGSALTNDRVAVRAHKRGREGPRAYFGSIHSILKRDKEFAVGFFEEEGGRAIARNHNLGFSEDILISNPKKISVKKGDCIKAKIVFYPKGQSLFKAELTENFGPVSSSAKDDIKRIMAEQGLPFGFSKEAQREAESLPDKIRAPDFSDRRSLKGKAFVTIDGATAQDFDDAIFVEKRDGIFRLYIAIADVSYYVEEGSALDKEAFERGNSSYFPGFCSPMLPEKLSADLCSLRAGEDRLAMVQEMDFDFQGDLVRSDIYPAVIQSRQRLTYGQAQEILDGSSPLKGDFASALKLAQALAQILLKRHIKGLALDLDIPETLILVDERGETQDIISERRLFSHLMIEQFMLSANKAVSAFLERKKTPLMYRIHENPEREKLKSLKKFSQTLGFSQSLESRQHLARFLSQYKGHRRAPLIHKLILRSLPQARYSAFNKGHYGLNFASYTHFTSPIRRYCDLAIHRLIKKALSNDSKNALSPKEVEKRAIFISQREQNSVKAERRIRDIKTARFAKRLLGKSFFGYVSSVSSFGLFVTLKKFSIEGLVRFQDLRGYWEADEFGLSAVNKGSSYRIQFGDDVEVLISASSVLTGKIDFKLLSHKGRPVEGAAPGKAGGRRRESGKNHCRLKRGLKN